LITIIFLAAQIGWQQALHGIDKNVESFETLSEAGRLMGFIG
jgi:hypothetical protein